MTAIARLINKALGQDDLNAPVPDQLMPLFAIHLASFPNDTAFLYERDTNLVTCLEDSCYIDIQCSPGVLNEFHNHISQEPAHRAARDKRVGPLKAAAPAPAPPPVVKPPIFNANANAGPSRLGSQGTPTPSGSGRQPVASGSGSGPFGTSNKRTFSPAGNPDPKRAKGVLADKVNNPFPPVPAAPAANLPLANYLAQWNDLTHNLAVANATLVSQRATPAATEDYYAALDALRKRVTNYERTLKNWKSTWGLPVGAAAAAQAQPVKGNSDLMRQRMANGGAAVGPVGGAAGAMMDAVDVLPGPMAYGDEEYGGVATGDDFNTFLQSASEGQDFEGNLKVDEAAAKLKLATQKTPIAGMSIPLMPHQIIGVAWMADQEESKAYGGILGDEMGLGKTVQTIACMAFNPSTDPKEKTTLIIAPLALLSQWKAEIIDKTEHNHWRILIHHGKERAKTAKELSEYDVVLTTYHTLAGEWPDMEALAKKAKKTKKDNGDDGDESDDFIEKKKAGPLFNLSWFRIVLDEAQNIRNRNTKISRSVSHLESLFRWCLTGTPITNSLADIYPLLRFLEIKPWYQWKAWREHVTMFEKKNPTLAGRRAQAVLRQHMLRRKKDSKLDGKELVTLPKKTVELRVLEFTKEEREIYSFVETRSQATFNKYLKQGTVLKNYVNVLVMLLRLRQLCLHPCLIADGFDALATEVQDERIRERELERARKTMGAVPVARLRKRILERMIERMRAEKDGEEVDIDDDDCPICMEPCQVGEGGGVVTRCGHAFCKPCVLDVLKGPAHDQDVNDAHAIKYRDDERPCPTCRGPVAEGLIFSLAAFEPTDEEVADASGDMDIGDDGPRSEDDQDDDDEEFADLDALVERKMAKAKRAASKKASSSKASSSNAPSVPKQKNRAIVIDSDDEEEESGGGGKDEKMSSTKAGKQKAKELPGWMASQEPSTKLIWLYEEIARVAIEAPTDKFIVISQFTTALDLVEDYLMSKGVGVTRYQGDMNAAQREESVRVLSKSKKCMVLLMSLKCGGVGLNLVRANRVVNMDLAWSHAVEQQAFDRAHRIGQVKEVQVDRLTISNTVEQRIGELQERKKLLADHSLGEGSGKRLGKLTVADLANLFGLDPRGNVRPSEV